MSSLSTPRTIAPLSGGLGRRVGLETVGVISTRRLPVSPRKASTTSEVVVVDNGSTDGSDGIIADWVRRDGRFRSSFLPQPGISRALNHGVALARGQLLARLDADDVALGDRLAIQHAIMRENPGLGLLGGFAELIDERGRHLGERRHPTCDRAMRAFLPFGCPVITSTVMMRRDVFRRVGGYREGLNLSEDYDLWCRIAETARVGNVDRVLSRYRVHVESASQRFEPRLWLTTTCVVAAQSARRHAVGEPFVRGRPSLRRALRQLGISREAYLREIRPKRLRHRLHRL